MDRKIVTRRIADIRKELLHLNHDICVMDSVDIEQYPENYEVVSTEAGLRAERIACRLRSLIYASTNVDKMEYLARAGEAQGIEIRCEDGIMEVTMPRLLPKKRMRRSNLFLLDPLQALLKQYSEENRLPYFKKCVVCICHVYDCELPEWCLLDYDNVQQKQILDMIALYVMEDDSGLLCDVYHTTEFGEKEGTNVFIMEQNQFAGWLCKYKNTRKNISDF